jgi:hypothetical protein
MSECKDPTLHIDGPWALVAYSLGILLAIAMFFHAMVPSLRWEIRQSRFSDRVLMQLAYALLPILVFLDSIESWWKESRLCWTILLRLDEWRATDNWCRNVLRIATHSDRSPVTHLKRGA